jgi:hypothetical protein
MNEEQVRESLGKFAGRFGPVQSLLAVVESVNEADKTCVLVDDDGEKFFDVRLRPVINGKESMTLFPKVGGWALAVRIEKSDDWMLVMADELTKFRVKIGNTVLEQDATKFEVSNNATSLKSLLDEIVTEMLAIYAPKNVANITAIKTKIPLLFK